MFGSGLAKKAREVKASATLPGAPTSDGPFPTGSATAKCKGKLTFGGFAGDVSLAPDGPAILPFSLERSGKKSWAATGLNDGTGTGKLTSLAYCGGGGKVKPSDGTATVPPQSTGQATASCTGKTSVRSGGYEAQFDATTSDPGVVVTAMQRTSAKELTVTAFNGGEHNSGSLAAITYCGKGSKLKQKKGSIEVPPGITSNATAKCPKHTKVFFGGFAGETNFATFNPVVPTIGLESPSKTSVSAKGLNIALGGDPGAVPGAETAFAYCG